jgi:hypothetical protein
MKQTVPKHSVTYECIRSQVCMIPGLLEPPAKCHSNGGMHPPDLKPSSRIAPAPGETLSEEGLGLRPWYAPLRASPAPIQ